MWKLAISIKIFWGFAEDKKPHLFHYTALKLQAFFESKQTLASVSKSPVGVWPHCSVSSEASGTTVMPGIPPQTPWRVTKKRERRPGRNPVQPLRRGRWPAGRGRSGLGLPGFWALQPGRRSRSRGPSSRSGTLCGCWCRELPARRGGRGRVVGLYGDGGLPAQHLPPHPQLRPGSFSRSSTRSKEEAAARSRDSPPPLGGKALAFWAAQLLLGAMGAQLPGGLVPGAASGRPKAAPSLAPLRWPWRTRALKWRWGETPLSLPRVRFELGCGQ